MATQTIVTITDDIDGSADAETVRFALAGQAYEIDLSSKNVEKLQKALQPFIDKARRPGGGAGPTRRSRSTGAASAPKTDYTDPAHAGTLHRGKVTDEEAAWVRSNLDAANKNRASAGQPAIDPSDAKEKKRYGF